jgi:hypothetical protein
MEQIMTTNHMRTTISAPTARSRLGSMTRLAIAAALGLGIGFHVGRTMSKEPPPLLQPVIGPATSAGETAAQAVSEGPAYLPSQVVNKAKQIEPLPPTF